MKFPVRYVGASTNPAPHCRLPWAVYALGEKGEMDAGELLYVATHLPGWFERLDQRPAASPVEDGPRVAQKPARTRKG